LGSTPPIAYLFLSSLMRKRKQQNCFGIGKKREESCLWRWERRKRGEERALSVCLVNERSWGADAARKA